MTTPIFDMTDTWNNAAVTFNGIKMNVTNAASAADSKLMDIQLGGVSRLNVGLLATFNYGEFYSGVFNGNQAVIQGSAAGQQGVVLGAFGPDSAINVHIVPKGNAGVNLYSNGSLQAAAGGPAGTTRYIQLTGSISGNPRVIAAGGGQIEIDSLYLTGNPTLNAPLLAADDSNHLATTHFVKQQGFVKALGPVTLPVLAAYAATDGTLIQPITMPPTGLTLSGGGLFLTDDLLALELLTGINTIYYRSGNSAWAPVTIGPSLSFASGTLDVVAGGGILAPAEAEYIVKSAHGGLTAERVLTDSATITWDFSVAGQVKAISSAGGGNVSTSGSIVVGNYARWAGATSIEARTPAQVLSDIGGQSVDPTLTALAGLSTLADQIIYSTGADAFQMTALTPFMRTLLDDTSGPLALATLGAAPLDSPAFFGTATSQTPATADNSIRIATTAYVKNQGYQTSVDVNAAIAAQAQPLDGDLTAIAALSGTNTIYYRSAANTWSPVTIGSNMTFSGGVLNSTATGSGNVSNSGTPNVNELAQWTDATHIKGLPIATHRTNAKFTGTLELASSGDLTTTNGWRIQGAASGGNPTISAQGVDPDIGFFFSSKGNGQIFFYNGNFGRVCLQLGSAAGSTAWPALLAFTGYWQLGSNGVVSAPINVDSTQVTIGTSGNLAAEFRNDAVGSKIKGRTDGGVSGVGRIGEDLTTVQFTGVSIPASSTANAASITLNPGDWDVWVQGHVSAGSASPTFAICGLSAVSNTQPTAAGSTWTATLPSNNFAMNAATRWRFNVSATTPVYFVITAGAQIVNATGGLFARRIG